MLEVGSWEGASTLWFIRNVLNGNDSRITCVDTWHGGGGMPNIEDDSVYDTFKKNLGLFDYRVDIIRMRSEDALPRLLPVSFDVIYIDGSHYASDVLSDSVLAWRLLKKEGLMIWDDYLYEVDDLLLMPRMAINSFLCCYERQHKMMGLGYQVCVKKV